MKELYDFSDIPHEESLSEKILRIVEVIAFCTILGGLVAIAVIPFAVNYYMSV